MKIAITGGSGFIGGNLAKRLKDAGHEIIIIDKADTNHYPETLKKLNICDLGALTKSLKGCDAIYHLAAEHRDDVSPVQKYYDVNVDGGKNVALAAEANNINTIIFTSTVAVYGLDAGESTEENIPNPFNDYGHSKLNSEKAFKEWAEKDRARTLVTLRLVATFGIKNRGNIYTLISQIARGKFLIIGSGKNHKSIAYVGNVAAFLEHMLTLKSGKHLYNYADKPDLNMKEMVTDIRKALGLNGAGTQIPYIIGLLGGMVFDIAAKITGKKFPISKIRVRKFCANTVVNADKLKKTGFKRPFTLQEGLTKMITTEFPKA